MTDLHDLEGIALLREPVRRQLPLHVRSTEQPVSRDDAAAAVGVSRSLAAFHLDRLAAAGLLEVEYRRVSGLTGRGAGRPAKLYRPGRRMQLSLPATRYQLAGDVLIRALEGKRPDEEAVDAVRRIAAEHGRSVAPLTGASGRRRSPMGRVRAALEELGFEPTEGRDEVLLRSCPFHELMDRHPGIVCPMNESLLAGLVDELGKGEVVAEPFSRDGYCCVAVRRAKGS